MMLINKNHITRIWVDKDTHCVRINTIYDVYFDYYFSNEKDARWFIDTLYYDLNKCKSDFIKKESIDCIATKNNSTSNKARFKD